MRGQSEKDSWKGKGRHEQRIVQLEANLLVIKLVTSTRCLYCAEKCTKRFDYPVTYEEGIIISPA